jgi:hypothetical protein
MNILEIIKRAWKIIWKHKILWVFGILASCVPTMTGGGGHGGGGSSGNANAMIPGSAFSANYSNFLADVPPYAWILVFIGIFAIGLIISVLFLMAGTLGTVGVIKGTGMADDAGLDAKPISFKAIFNAIKPYYWKVFLIYLILPILGIILVLLFLIPILIITACTCGLIWLIFIPISWFIQLMVIFTMIVIVEEEKGIFEAIEHAWRVVSLNLGQVILMFIVLGIGQIVVSLLVAGPFILSLLPTLINLLVTGGSADVGLIITGVLVLIFLPVAILVMGGVKALVLSSWTLTYRQLTTEGGLNPIIIEEEEEEEEEVEKVEEEEQQE